MRDVCDPQVAEKVKPLWVPTDEGELSGIWRDSGHESLWFGLGTLPSCIRRRYSRFDDEKKGNLGLSRYYSRHLALRKSIAYVKGWIILTERSIEIKAIEAGILKASEVKF